MSFGDTTSPTFNIVDMEIIFEVLIDHILEGTERGRVQIASNPDLFAGHEPLFGNVDIVIKDDESIIYNTDY